MFTGIIEEIGTVDRIQTGKEAITFGIKAKHILADVHLGDSISVNGVCLTVTDFTRDRFSVDVMPETIKATTLQHLKQGSSVNLERAMAANGRFGGHFVSGHVDGTGIIRNKTARGNAVYYEIATSPELIDTMILKGSVAVDGTSLTIFGLEKDSFTISLIPHTTDHTVLGSKGKGEIVNVECDMLGKYIKKMMQPKEEQPKSTSTMQNLLKDSGFMN